MKVLVNLCTPPGSDHRVTELVTNTIRVGFPSADIVFYDNGGNAKITPQAARTLGAALFPLPLKSHHTWLRSCIQSYKDYSAPVILLDGDIIFWDNVECWQPPSTWAGFYIPGHYSQHHNAFVMPRLHTSFLWFRSGEEAARLLIPSELVPSKDEFKPYVRESLIDPFYAYIEGRPVYYDTCAGLYHKGRDGSAFPQRVLDCYDHVTAASFYQPVLNCLTDHERARFIYIHTIAANYPEQLRGLYKETQMYYSRRFISLETYLAS